MKVIPLGTNGFFPSFCRATSCFVIPIQDTLIILDAGSGLFRLAEPEGSKLLKGINNIHLFLSHYHLDHTFGLYAAFKLLEGKKVTVFAPTSIQTFSEFIPLGNFSKNYSKKFKNFIWKKLEKDSFKQLSYQVSVREQNHRGELSIGFRFQFKEANFAYITDTDISNEGIEFIKGVDLLLHEHGLLGSDQIGKKIVEQIQEGHVTTIGAAIIAKKAKVGKLALIHQYPFYDNRRLEKQLEVARSIFPNTYLAHDLQEIEF